MAYLGTRTSADNLDMYVYPRMRRLAHRLWRGLPRGGYLPEEIWYQRHKGILLLLWLQAMGIVAFGVATRHGFLHSLTEASIVAALAALASFGRLPRGFKSGAATFGLVTTSAILVHLSGGLIEMHFHFFVMIGIITLYQDWLPFLLAIAYVVGHHGLMGVLDPASVYNHAAALNGPWRWAAVHGVFVIGASIASVAAWKLNEEGFRDPLTGLANRSLFYDRVEHALLRQKREGTRVAALFLDLDDFKTINDSLGHAAGDQLLVDVADRVKRSLRASDTVARLGGDEFAILLEGLGDVDPVRLAQRILIALGDPFVLGGRQASVTVSIGIALSVGGRESTDVLLRNADVAMYQAKTKGKGRYEAFEQGMQTAVLERLDLKGDLERAIERKQLTLNYQPIFDLRTNRMAGVEALLRWHHPRRGLVPPAEFIPLAEETGLIVPIDRWVLREACAQAASWRATYGSLGSLRMSVNISAQGLQDPGLVGETAAILEESGLEPSGLIIELTESVLVQDSAEVVERLQSLRDLGAAIAIDDFGTGYSSLSYVRQFPVDILKVDKAFIDPVADGGEGEAVAKIIIQLGQSLGLEVVAEGIERLEQVERLKTLGCHVAQGFYFARPLPTDGVDALLRQESLTAGDEHSDLPTLPSGWSRVEIA
jgi:diguanylate cyclase (GGDEF)-like protein